MSSNDNELIKKENQLVIGICGPSTSGKSTIIEEIMTIYEKYDEQFSVIPMEKYFRKYKAPKTEIFGKKFTNLDLKKSIDWKLFFKAIARDNSPILIIDGFILFADPRSADLVDVCVTIEYNIETDFEIALDRRIHRYPWTRDAIIEKDYLENPFKNPVNEHCTYFHEIVWPEMVKHPEYIKPQNWEKPILNLSATSELQENVSKTLNFLKPFFDSHLKQ